MKSTVITSLISSGLAFHLLAADPTLEKPISHEDVADGSGGVAVGTDYFINVCDEDNVLRLYPRTKQGMPVKDFDFNDKLGLTDKNKKGELRECDLEGAALLKGSTPDEADLVFWIGSHSRNKEGKSAPNRHILFATQLKGAGADTKPKLDGAPYRGLLAALQADSRYAAFNLNEASEKAPEAEGGLNIEGLCTDGKRLLIGFRNPIPQGKALIVSLENPREVIQGKAPVFGAPTQLDLGGLGIRDMAAWRDQFLIVTGGPADRVDGKPVPKLFQWKGGANDAPKEIKVDLNDFNPEGVIVYGSGDSSVIQILSDDGKVPSFRSVEIKMPAP